MKYVQSLRQFLKRAFLEIVKFFGVVIAVFAVVVCFIAALIGLHLYQEGRYDTEDPDYRVLHTLFGYPPPNEKKPKQIDLALINKGDWEVFCFVGGYMQPQKVLASFVQAKGLRVHVPSFIIDPYRRLMFQVEEHEMALAYVTKDGDAKIVHFPGYSLQHGSKCTTRHNPMMKFPIYIPG